MDTIEDAEDREKFQVLLNELKIKQPANGIARTMAQARSEVQKIGFPCLVRPSFVLGGRAMEICYDHSQFERFVAEAFVVAQGQPVLIDRFLEDATEVDVDAVSDGDDVVIMGIMEHIEEAGVHSGDSACVIPSFSFSPDGTRGDSASDRRHGQTIEGGWVDERSVCDQGRGWQVGRLCAGSQSASKPHGSVRCQSDRNCRRQYCDQSHGWKEVERVRYHQRTDTSQCLRQGIGVPVPQVCGGRHRLGAGDAEHGRSDGDQRRIPDRIQQEPDRSRSCARRARAMSL